MALVGNTERLFLALELPDPVFNEVEKTRILIERDPGFHLIRILPLSNMHLTLHFLGDIEIAKRDGIAEQLEHVIACNQPVSVGAADCGYFQRAGIPFVFWLGCSMSKELQELHHSTAAILRSAGVNLEKRPYQPHITLGYARKEALPEQLFEAGSKLAGINVDQKEGLSSTVLLVKSRLQQSGAMHEVIERFSMRL